MIAWAGIERLGLNLVDDKTFAARPRWPLDANAQAANHEKALSHLALRYYFTFLQ
ncbi:MAG: hypothetical protein OTI36_14080 [Beijerinckiaceae bacterium]|nr:hypothetical protein [Beijerinckiaceae bacterium]